MFGKTKAGLFNRHFAAKKPPRPRQLNTHYMFLRFLRQTTIVLPNDFPYVFPSFALRKAAGTLKLTVEPSARSAIPLRSMNTCWQPLASRLLALILQGMLSYSSLSTVTEITVELDLKFPQDGSME